MAVWFLSPRSVTYDVCCDCQPALCDECLCGATLDTAGGDEGYDHTFTVTGDFVSARDIYVAYEMFTIKDQLIISADAVEKYNSGCVSGNATVTVNIPAGTDQIRVQIVPHCEGGTGTAWTLSIDCA